MITKRKVHTRRIEDHATQQHVEALQQSGNEVLDVEIVQGRLFENVTLAPPAVTILKHGLERKWRGSVVVKNSSTNPVSQATDPRPESEIHLSADKGPFTISLWVF